ncbi:hypothetical protein TNCV_3008581 [Trichonephila clavipes]|nr:hypothetical protein TNCV_3008581 [Trichonephila clavipes]
MILLKLSRERNEAHIVIEALGPGPVGSCLKTYLIVENYWDHCALNGTGNQKLPALLNLEEFDSRNCTCRLVNGITSSINNSICTVWEQC